MTELGRMLGRWSVEGGATGTVTYEFMPGGFFLQQHVDLHQDGLHIEGVETAGHEFNPFTGQPANEHVTSFFFYYKGNTVFYTWELNDDTLTIWAGEKGSPAYYRGTFTHEGNVLTGSWVYSGGGGYDTVQTRH